MTIRCDVMGARLLVVTSDRPERKNPIDLHHFRDLATAWRSFRGHDGMSVAIVQGVEGFYMSRAELMGYVPHLTVLSKETAGEVDEIDGCRLPDGTEAVLPNMNFSEPIIVAIGGPCVAGGTECSAAATFGWRAIGRHSPCSSCSGAATDGVCVCDVGNCVGWYAEATDLALLDALEVTEWVGRQVPLVPEGDRNLVLA